MEETVDSFLIYGANGYTGGLIARTAVAQGHRPIVVQLPALVVAGRGLAAPRRAGLHGGWPGLVKCRGHGAVDEPPLQWR
jgi:hypothetical protein